MRGIVQEKKNNKYLCPNTPFRTKTKKQKKTKEKKKEKAKQNKGKSQVDFKTLLTYPSKSFQTHS